MACACNKSSGNPAESYVVRRPDGRTTEFSSKVQADIEVTKTGGTIEVKRSK